MNPFSAYATIAALALLPVAGVLDIVNKSRVAAYLVAAAIGLIIAAYGADILVRSL